MNNPLDKFEKVTRLSYGLGHKTSNKNEISQTHPFDAWDIHPKFFNRVKKLFDNEHYGESTFQACKIIEDRVKKLSAVRLSGVGLMMNAFDEKKPLILLCDYPDNKDKYEDIQKGYRFIFSGFFSAIRNLTAHGSDHIETRKECLEHLVFASFLMRKLDKAEEIKKSKAKS